MKLAFRLIDSLKQKTGLCKSKAGWKSEYNTDEGGSRYQMFLGGLGTSEAVIKCLEGIFIC